jgi:nicotinamide mononucleotide transporter
MNPVELVAVVLGLLSVWLNVREDVRGWPIGAIMVALYFFLFARVKLYADAGLQVVYFVLQFYGWHEWLHGGDGRGRLAVSHTPARVIPACLLLGATGTWLLGSVLGRYTDQALPFWDSGIASFSLVAQWMLARKYLENWLLWAAIDIIAIGVYWIKNLELTALLYFLFLLLCVRGYQQWRASLDALADVAPEAPGANG